MWWTGDDGDSHRGTRAGSPGATDDGTALLGSVLPEAAGDVAAAMLDLEEGAALVVGPVGMRRCQTSDTKNPRRRSAPAG